MSCSKLRFLVLGAFALTLSFMPAIADVDAWKKDWLQTDFSRHSVDLTEISSGGIARDVIPGHRYADDR